MDEVEKSRILENIASSFSSIPYPHGDDYFKAIADRDYLEFKPGGRKKYWDSISEDELLKYYDFIFFLPQEGVIYYLPSYIKLIIENPQIADQWCGESLFMAISDLDSNLLGIAQKESLVEFLQYCLNSIHPKNELDDELVKKAISNLGD